MAKVLKRDHAASVDCNPSRSKRGRLLVKKGESKIFVVPARFRISLQGSFPLALAACSTRVWDGGPAIAPGLIDVSDLRARCACGAFAEYCLPQFCPGAIDNTVEL